MSTSPPPVWAFPFAGGCVSKPPLPFVSTADDEYNLRGISNGGDEWGQPFMDEEGELNARWFCCWIEAAMHALLVNPYLRWFVQDYKERWVLTEGRSETEWIVKNPFDASKQKDLHERYTHGVAAMAYLSARLRLDVPLDWTATNAEIKQSQVDFDNAILPMLKQFRAAFKDNDRYEKDNRGDPAKLLQMVMPGLWLFIACNWSGNEFQRQFMAYGCNALKVCVQRCAGASGRCFWFGKDVEFFDGAKADTVLVGPASSAHLLDMTDIRGLLLHIWLENARIELELADELTSQWSGLWQLPNNTECEGCDQIRMQLVKLVTLPFMLYIAVSRAEGARLRYDPNELTIGPTRDNHYATYKLVCRVEYQPSQHYVADVRMSDRSFTRYNFHSLYERQKIPAVDSSCTLLVWQREDKRPQERE
jgi:hypothetical protein